MKKNLSLAIIAPFPPSSDGIADYTSKLVTSIKGLSEAIDIHIYSFKKDGKSSEKQHPLLSLNLFDWVHTYRSIIKQNPSLLHLQFDVSNYMLLIFPLTVLLFFLRRKGISLVATYHEAYRDRELYGALSIVFYRLFNLLFHRIYVHTHLSEKCLIDIFKAPREKVVHIPHGTATFVSKQQNHSELRQRYAIADNESVILNFGYIYTSKGIEYLISALHLLKKQGAVVPVLLIAGKVPKRKGLLKPFQWRNESYLQRLKEQIRLAQLEDKVKFIGFVPSEEVYSIFTLAKLVVLPYVSVDQSGVLNTAIAAHTPAIATTIGGLQETLQDTGILVPPRNAEAIAAEIQRYLYNDALLRKTRKAYEQLAATLDTRAAVEILLKDYEKVLHGR